MDISSGNGYPSSALSNFAPHEFILDGIKCASMEGFLQSLKFKNPDMQEHICSLVGMSAKKKGSHKNWHKSQTLYWRGIPYKRDSQEYQDLLDRAYIELGKNEGFKKALIATKGMTLTHSIGKNKQADTVLTTQEFISRLYKQREIVLEEQKER